MSQIAKNYGMSSLEEDMGVLGYETVIVEARLEFPKGFDKYIDGESGGRIVQSHKTASGDFVIVTDDGSYYKSGKKYVVWAIGKGWKAPDPKSMRKTIHRMKAVTKSELADQIDAYMD